MGCSASVAGWLAVVLMVAVCHPSSSAADISTTGTIHCLHHTPACMASCEESFTPLSVCECVDCSNIDFQGQELCANYATGSNTSCVTLAGLGTQPNTSHVLFRNISNLRVAANTFFGYELFSVLDFSMAANLELLPFSFSGLTMGQAFGDGTIIFRLSHPTGNLTIRSYAFDGFTIQGS